MHARTSSILCVLALCVSCSGGSGTRQSPADVPVSPVVISRIDVEPAGEHCPAGGQAVRSGVDGNADGILQDGEVQTVQYVCAAPARTLLVRTREEAPGPSCASGGTAVLSGVDSDGDGVLSDGEAVQITYVCAEDLPPVLAATTPLATGSSDCPDGGSRVTAGPDRNGNGILDADEIQVAKVVCGGGVLVQTERVGTTTDACAGGTATRVRAGVDADGDGSLSDAETMRTEYVCSGEAWSYTVRDQADLDYLRDEVDLVRGDLVVESPDLTEVSIPSIAVTGAVRVRDCPALTGLSVNAAMIGGDVEVARTPELTYLGIRLLPFSSLDRMPILGDLTVTDAGKLGTIDVGEVPYVQGSVVLRRVGVDRLEGESLYARPGLQWIGGDLRLEECGPLSDVALGDLYRIGGSLVLNGCALAEWRAPYTLQQIGRDVIVEDDAALGGVWLDSLTAVGGSFRIEGNPVLTTVSHHVLRSVGGSYVLAGNATLDGSGSLPSEETTLSIGGEVRVEQNAVLRGLPGLIRVDHVGSGISIADNPALTYVSMPALPSTPTISILRNAALAYVGHSDHVYPNGDSLTGLRSCGTLEVRENPKLARLELPAVTQLGTLAVTDNPALPTCQAQAVAAQGHATTVTVTGNLDGATCP